MRDPDRLPVKLGPCGTEEYAPLPLDAVTAAAVRLAREACDDNARRTGMSRRAFLRSTCAVATTLLALDACSKAAHKAAGRAPGGAFRIPREATTEPDAARAALSGNEFVLDVQGHLLEDQLVMVGHHPVPGGVARPGSKRRRTFDVGEEDRQRLVATRAVHLRDPRSPTARQR